MTDSVNKPTHYTRGKVECIDALESAVTGLEGVEALLTGQAIKYLWRWKWKGRPAEDLRKARWYLDRLLARVSASPSSSSIDTTAKRPLEVRGGERTRLPPIPPGAICDSCRTCWHRPADRPGVEYRVSSPHGPGVACRECHRGNRWELPFESLGRSWECEGCANTPRTQTAKSREELFGSSCFACRGGANWRPATQARQIALRQS